MKLKLHHIGIAVKEIDSVIKLFSEKLGIEFEGTEEVNSQKVKVTFTKEYPAIELVQATQKNSPQFPVLPHPIESFIQTKGEGLHHLCFSVPDIEIAFKRFSHLGIKILGKTIQEGSKGKRIFFIDPNETAGILIEIKEEK